jgi:hypothetical protein
MRSSLLLTAAAACVFDLREDMRCSLENAASPRACSLHANSTRHISSRGIEEISARAVFYVSAMRESRQGLCALRSAPARIDMQYALLGHMVSRCLHFSSPCPHGVSCMAAASAEAQGVWPVLKCEGYVYLLVVIVIVRFISCLCLGS